MIRLFTGVSLLSLAVCTPAWAEDAASEDAAPEIVVTGSRPIAESEAAALEIQKRSDSLVAVIASDSVGRLPDQNIAQATSRLPGLAVESDQGQPRYVSIRGAPKNWTTLSFDGINVVSPEGRDARFDSVPSAIASQIVVSKAVTPDMPGETVAGNVNVITRSAFDYSGFHVAGKAGYGVAEYSSRPQYEGSLVLSDRFQVGGGEIGILVSGSYFQRAMVTDNFEIDWERVGDQTNATTVPGATGNDRRPGFQSRIWAHEAENKLYRLTRRNWSVSGRLDWKPDADNTISLRSIYTIFKDDEARDNYRFDLDDRQGDLVTATAACGAPPAMTTSGYGDICTGNTPLTGTLYGVDIRQRSTLRAFRQSIFTNTLEGDHKFGDGWTVNWLGNYTVSKDDRSVIGETTWDQSSTRTTRPTVMYDFSDPQRSRTVLYTTLQSGGVFSAGNRVVDIDSFLKPLSGMTVLDAVDTTTAYTGRLIVTKDAEFLGGEATFKAGFQFDQRRKVVDERQLTLTAAQANAAGMPSDYNQFSIDLPFQGKIPLDYTFRYFNTDKMREVSAAARSQFGNLFLPATGNIYDVREQVYAGYLMGTLRYDWGSIIGGVRVEHIKNRGMASGTIGAVTGPITAESSQTLVFPSLHFNFNVDDTKKLRLSFNTGAARADYDQMRPNITVNDSNQTISGGNPGIKPEKAWGLDAYFEWYVQPQGYFMVGAFYKKVTDVLYTSRRTFGSDALNDATTDRSEYLYSGITNAGDGRIYGLEAAAQFQLEPFTDKLGLPDWMGGFGINANITLNNSEVNKPTFLGAGGSSVPARKVRLPNASDVVFNIGAYYEKYGLSLKLQYQKRSKWLDTIADDDTDGGDTYWAADDEMDFSARYAINKNFEVFFDATNLLNKPGRRFVDPSGVFTARGNTTAPQENYTIEWERFGRRYAGGVRFNF
jgi:TonB-dependent receptor